MSYSKNTKDLAKFYKAYLVYGVKCARLFGVCRSDLLKLKEMPMKLDYLKNLP